MFVQKTTGRVFSRWNGQQAGCLVIFSLVIVFVAAGVGEAGVLAQLGGEWQTGIDTSCSQEDWSTTARSLLRLQLRAGSHPWRFYADASTELKADLDSDSGWELEGDLERLYLKLYLPAADVSLGKQRINWGVGYAWAPTDLFNPPDPLDPDGRRLGVSAAVVRFPVGPLAYWSFVAARKDGGKGLTGKRDSWQYGIRRRGNYGTTDWSVLVITDTDTTTVGGDLKGDLGIGWHGEAAYRMPSNGSSRGWEAVVGGDYSWDDGRFVWLGEYFYNSAGAATKDTYDYTAWLGGQERYLARHYAFNQLTYQYDEFTSLGGSVLTNIVDGSAAWTVGANIFLTGAWQLSLAATVFTGEEGDEFAGGSLPSYSAALSRPDCIVKAQVVYSF